ncbi:hypothetical protein A2U01_0094324, partial [Trifolium medium]|nr:hypothetical protein [Trifolium medium]
PTETTIYSAGYSTKSSPSSRQAALGAASTSRGGRSPRIWHAKPGSPTGKQIYK